MKKCARCLENKSDDSFYPRQGGKYLSSYCRECQSEINKSKNSTPEHKTWSKANRIKAKRVMQHYVRDYLLAHPCVDCGESDPVVLEFDHVRGVKKMAVSQMLYSSYALRTVQAEIEKCEVRCANCHRRITAQRGGWHALLIEMP